MTLETSYLHRGGSVALLGDTIDQYLSRMMRERPEHTALVSRHQGVRLSYGQLDLAATDLARGLMGMGVEKGDRVGIWAANNVEWAVIQLATARIGAILVNINPACRVRELRHVLRSAAVQVLILTPAFRSSDYPALLAEMAPELASGDAESLALDDVPSLRHLVIYDPADARASTRPSRAYSTWQELLQRGQEISTDQVRARSRSLDRDDPINIQFTSGTTGLPKPVVLTHHNLLNNAYFVGRAMRLGDDDRLCLPVPYYHCFGMVLGNLACFAHGAAVVLPGPHFNAEEVLDAIVQERCTAVHGVPTMFVATLEALRESEHKPTTLRTGIMAGAPCPPELMRRMIDELGCREILIAYGQTEASPVTHCTVADDTFEHRIASVGSNLPHQEVKVVDPNTGMTVPVGQQGEVCFRGYHVMHSYYRDPEATAKTVDNTGWLHSGDLGVMADDGYLRITGRLKDMIIRGGENIYPAEIESLYFSHPQVAEIAVFGVPDAVMGEEVGAWIKLRPGQSASPEALREWARDKISHFKIPRYVWLVDEFPMTVTGKIQKFKIRDIASRLVVGSDAEAPSGRAGSREA